MSSRVKYATSGIVLLLALSFSPTRSTAQEPQLDDAGGMAEAPIVSRRALSLWQEEPAVHLGEAEDAPEEPSLEFDENHWTFELAPYVWGASINADTRLGPIDATVDENFVDLVSRLDIAAMLHFEGRKGRWGFFLDGLYMRLSDNARVRFERFKVGGIDIDGSLKQILFEAAMFYRFGNKARYIDVLAGARYMYIGVKAKLGPFPSIDRDRDWVDPFVGGRFRVALSERWFLAARGDIGGFKTGSHLTWNVMAHFAYQMTEKSTLAIGYRHLDIDYRSSKFDFDAELSGPYIGVNFRF